MLACKCQILNKTEISLFDKNLACLKNDCLTHSIPFVTVCLLSLFVLLYCCINIIFRLHDQSKKSRSK